MKTVFHGLSVSILALSLVACTTAKPVPLDRAGDVPATFTAPQADANAPIWPEANWWGNFQSDELPALVQRAQAENLDLQVAAARVLQAEALSTQAFSALLPTIGAGFDVDRRGSRAATTNSFAATFSGSYVLDVFGANRNALLASRENLRAARYAQASVGLTIQGAVAEAYFNILALREQVAITRQNVDAAKRLLTITRAKFDSGVASNFDVASEQASVSQQEARLPILIEQERQAHYTLAVLLGQAPQGFDIKGQNLNGLVSPNVKGGVPSEILARRPDIAQAEANLAAAHANLDAARAAYFPQFSLSGSAGWVSGVFDTLINPSSFAWSIGASVVQSIFNGGRTTAQNQFARAEQTAQIATYRKTVFTAFQDVENAIGNVQSINEQLSHVVVQEQAAREAFRIAELQYREGTIDVTALLLQQQTLFSAQTQLVQTKQARLNANVRMYIALGGGWQQQQSDDTYEYQLDWWPL